MSARAFGIVAFVLVAMVASALFPLLVYSTTLALFGLAHVASEMYYVDHRFGRRVKRELVAGAAALLAAVVLVRALRMSHVVGDGGAIVELCLVCALGSLALPALFRRGPVQLAAGVVVVGSLALGTLAAPALTLVVLAVAHNATPLGFLVDNVDATKPTAARDRARVLALGALAFIGAPLLVATGVVALAAGAAGVVDGAGVVHGAGVLDGAGVVAKVAAADVTLLPTGPLRDHLFVYLPRSLWYAANAPSLFGAVVCAQVMHYGAVIGLLPRLIVGGRDVPLLPWPKPLAFVTAVVVVGGALFVHFALRFNEARSLYGLAAGVHAWIEVPVLLLALAGVTSSKAP